MIRVYIHCQVSASWVMLGMPLASIVLPNFMMYSKVVMHTMIQLQQYGLALLRVTIESGTQHYRQHIKNLDRACVQWLCSYMYSHWVFYSTSLTTDSSLMLIILSGNRPPLSVPRHISWNTRYIYRCYAAPFMQMLTDQIADQTRSYMLDVKSLVIRLCCLHRCFSPS